MEPRAGLETRIASLVEQATEGTVSRDDALVQGRGLIDAGISSLSFLRLVDAIENEFGVYVDLEDESASLGSVVGIADYIVAQGVAI
jgi:acyl carrier protein